MEEIKLHPRDVHTNVATFIPSLCYLNHHIKTQGFSLKDVALVDKKTPNCPPSHSIISVTIQDGQNEPIYVKVRCDIAKEKKEFTIFAYHLSHYINKLIRSIVNGKQISFIIFNRLEDNNGSFSLTELVATLNRVNRKFIRTTKLAKCKDGLFITGFEEFRTNLYCIGFDFFDNKPSRVMFRKFSIRTEQELNIGGVHPEGYDAFEFINYQLHAFIRIFFKNLNLKIHTFFPGKEYLIGECDMYVQVDELLERVQIKKCHSLTFKLITDKFVEFQLTLYLSNGTCIEQLIKVNLKEI